MPTGFVIARHEAIFWNDERILESLCPRALSLRGTNRSFANQSVGMMKGCLKAFARKLTDCFVPRKDRVESFNLTHFWNDEKIFKSLCLLALSLRGTNRSFANQSLRMMKRSLKAFALELTDCFVPRNDNAESMSKAKFIQQIQVNLALLVFKKNLFIFVCITQ